MKELEGMTEATYTGYARPGPITSSMMRSCAPAQPGEETCTDCTPVGTFGIVPASNKRYLGGHVDAAGNRHDPLCHADDCPRIA